MVTNVAVVWDASLLVSSREPEVDPASAVVNAVDPPVVLLVVGTGIGTVADACVDVGGAAGFCDEEAWVLEVSVEDGTADVLPLVGCVGVGTVLEGGAAGCATEVV